MAQGDYLLYIKDIQGETKQSGYADYIDVEAYSWGMSQQGTWAVGGGGAQGKASISDFNFVCKPGKHTAQLMKAVVSGVHPASAKLVCRKAGGGGKTFEYYIIDFENLIVSSVSESGAGEGSNSASVSFAFKKVTFDYKEQQPDGSVQSAAKAWYDQSAGTNG